MSLCKIELFRPRFDSYISAVYSSVICKIAIAWLADDYLDHKHQLIVTKSGICKIEFQMIVLFTIALLGPLGLVQGVQQCLYCTSGNHHHLTKHSSDILTFDTNHQCQNKKRDFEAKNIILSDPDGAFHDYDCAVGLVNLIISYSINYFTKLGN